MVVQEGVFIVALMKKGNQPLQVLLQYRKNTGLHDGKYAFPGGKRESNETLIDAAQRELYEETGLVVKQKQLQKLCRCGGKDRNGIAWQGVFYFCLLDPARKKTLVKEPNKHKEVAWYPIDNLPNNLADAVRKVISDLKNYFKPVEKKKDERKHKARKIVVPDLLNIRSEFKSD